MSEPSFPSRRDFLTLATGAFVVATVPWVRHRRIRLLRRTAPAMGTLAELAVVHPDERYAYAAMDAAIRELRRVEALMTRFKPTSDVGRANLAGVDDAVVVSSDTAAVLRQALDWAQASDGAFDPCLARLTDLWDVKHSHAPPPPGEVHRLAGRRLYRALDLDAFLGQPAVRFTDRDVRLDLGGIACGYGVDRAVAVLRAWGIENGFLNVGGDIYALGHADDRAPWRVGVRDPYDHERIAVTVELSDAAIATSGDYEQYFDYHGRRYGHIIDPATAEPRLARVHSVTVKAADCITADAATTAVFGASAGGAERILAARPGAELVHRG
jgi:FAD:protein FMN transferase